MNRHCEEVFCEEEKKRATYLLPLENDYQWADGLVDEIYHGLFADDVQKTSRGIYGIL